jgi:HK97 family phage portal protein
MKFKLLGRSIEVRVRNLERMPSPSDDSAWLSYLAGQGYAVSADTAIKVSAVFRCVDLLSKTMASLPLHMLEDTPRGSEKAKRHPLYGLVYTLPNEHTTAYEFWQMFVANLLLTRGGYAKIERDRRGYIRALWNIPTRAIYEEGTNKVNGERFIRVALGDGQTETLRTGDFLHVPNFRFSSATDSEDPMAIAADVLGLTRDLSTYAQATFLQGVNPGGFIEVPDGMGEVAYARLKEDFAKNYAGAQNSGRFLILEEGAKANIFTRDLEKTQALESRKFAVTEICRLFGVPAHLCMDMEHATFSNIEQQSREFVRDAINPLQVRIEQAMYRDLLTERERARYYFKFNTEGFLRGDTAARTAYYSAMRQNGIMSANEIRALEDMNKLDGAAGDIVAINGNMIALENVPLNIPKGAQKAESGGAK